MRLSLTRYLAFGHQPSSGRSLGQGHLGCSFTPYLFVSGRSGKPGSFAATDMEMHPSPGGPSLPETRPLRASMDMSKWLWSSHLVNTAPTSRSGKWFSEGSHQTHCFPLSLMVYWFCIFAEYCPDTEIIHLEGGLECRKFGSPQDHRKRTHQGLHHLSVSFCWANGTSVEGHRKEPPFLDGNRRLIYL